MQKTLRSPQSSLGSGQIGKKLPLDERLMLKLKESQEAGNKLQAKSYAKMLAYSQLHTGKPGEFKETAAKYVIPISDQASIMNDFLEIKIKRNDVDGIKLAMKSEAIQGWQIINVLLQTRRHIHLSQIAKQGLFGISSDEVAEQVSAHAKVMVFRMDIIRTERLQHALYPPQGSTTSENLAVRLSESGEYELSSLVNHGLLDSAALSKAFDKKVATMGRLFMDGFELDVS